VNGIRALNDADLSYNFNEYFRTTSVDNLDGKDMFVMANSNSIRPSRIYYKKINTQVDIGLFENKFIFPLYLTNDMNLLSSITGLSILRDVVPTSIKKSNNY